jgi:glutamyl-Q tRNA(Asp) synthetase
LPGSTASYRGRFAPSPTGPLHLGSLIAALASYLDARACGGTWLVRMEDLDPPREEPGAASAILQSLEVHGLLWDEEVLWQSQRHDAYRNALAQLQQSGHLFRCDCTRALLGPGGACRGRCLPRQAAVMDNHSTRVNVPPDTCVEFHDQLQGPISENLGEALPDFTLLRKDGLFAYQLAVVVDDAFQDITHVVRGSDLLDSTPRQIFLQRLLGHRPPHYCHLPVITNDLDQKFSKQNHAPALDPEQAGPNLRRALKFLHQPAPPPSTRTPGEILASACEHWSAASIPAKMSQPASLLGPQV